MNQNPLQQYFRQPKVFINLPSQGVYSLPGTFQGDITNMPVYGLTGMDEVILRTPDALMTGESTVKVIQSCCPNILNGWNLSSLDLDTVISAIRIATYGNMLTVGKTCDACGTHSEYEVNLMKVIDYFSQQKYDNRIVIDDLVIKTQPLNYKQSTNLSIRTYTFQQKLKQLDAIEDSEEKQVTVNALWEDLAEYKKSVIANSIESIETPTATVTERGYIEEWVLNCDQSIITKIKDHNDASREQWSMPPFPVKCENEDCKKEFNLLVTLDYSNFFG